MTLRKQTAQGLCVKNERQPNSQEHEDCLQWQRCNTPLLWPMWPSTHRIGKDIRACFYLFTRRAADVISEAFFTAISNDRDDELAAMDPCMIEVALTQSWLVWIVTTIPVWLCFSSFLLCSILFLNTKLYILYECSLCLICITVRKLTILLSVKTFKTRTVFRFLSEDFRLCSLYNNVNYGAWYVYKSLSTFSVATCRLSCFEITI